MDKDFQLRVQRIEALVQEIEVVADPDTRAKAIELMQSLMDFHGAGLERMMEIISEAGEPGDKIFDDFTRDGLVGSLLLLYELHPLDLEARVVKALEKVRPYLGSHGGDVELIGLNEGVVCLRMQGSCHGCPSSAMTLKLAIEEAIYEAAPDVVAIEVEGVVEQALHSGLVQLGKSPGNGASSENSDNHSKWEAVDGLESLAQAALRTVDVRGRPVIFCRLGASLYAYGDVCPACGETLQDARLDAQNLVCAHCERRYEIERAGRGLDQPDFNLEPFPLLIEQGQAKVALPRISRLRNAEFRI